jgi:hypothetical protein
MYAASAYIFTMFALYILGTAKMILEEGNPPWYFAFLPFVHSYARAVIVGLRGRYLRTLAPLSSICLLAALIFPHFYFLVSAILFYLVTRCFLNYYTYNRYAMLFTILGIIIPLSSGIWIFMTHRKRSY